MGSRQGRGKIRDQLRVPFSFAMLMDRLKDEVRWVAPWTMMFADINKITIIIIIVIIPVRLSFIPCGMCKVLSYLYLYIVMGQWWLSG